MHLAVIGLGASGGEVVRQLRIGRPDSIGVYDVDQTRVLEHVAHPGTTRTAMLGDGADVVVLATPPGSHAGLARSILASGRHVVSLSDHPGDVAELLDLDPEAVDAGCTVLVGAGFAPGLTCMLARHASDLLDSVEVVSVAKSGTGGPACAREHHRAMKNPGHEFHHGTWVMRAAGSGRELVWFPEPIGARDCYRADLPSPLLLQRVFPDADRLTSRVSATRRDRFTSRFPMLRLPHADGGPGAVRVEVRGRRDGGVETVVYGVSAHPSVAAGAVAAVAAVSVADGSVPHGAYGLGEHPGFFELLKTLRARDLRAETYVGTANLRVLPSNLT